jgi:flagellar hook assembly protein FlgD
MGQNYPNPFNPTTMISYNLAEVSEVSLVVYNILGQQIRVLVNHTQATGTHSIQWDGRDAIGRQVSSGMYIYRLVAGKNIATRKMIFAK